MNVRERETKFTYFNVS